MTPVTAAPGGPLYAFYERERPASPSEEVNDMEPVTGSFLAGILPGLLILALIAAVVVYGWWQDQRSQRKAEGSAFKKAA